MRFIYLGPDGFHNYHTAQIYDLDVTRCANSVAVCRRHTLLFKLAFWLDEGYVEYPSEEIFKFHWQIIVTPWGDL